VRPDGAVEIEDVSGELLAWLRSRGHARGSVVIVRPDRFVYGAVGERELSAATCQIQGELQVARATGDATPVQAAQAGRAARISA
jgi:3-(3-hydroxy-phenyl)propionate hydroxylase